MAGSFVASTQSNTAGGTDLTCNKPTGTTDNDIMLVRAYSGVACSAPAGWTQIGTDLQSPSGKYIYCWWKRASSEGADYAFALASGSYGAVCISSWRGFQATGDPIHAFSNTGYVTSNTTIRAATLDTTIPTFLIWLGSSNANPAPTVTSPDGYTEDHDFGEYYYSMFVAHKDCSAWTGTTGSVDGTLSGTITAKHAMLVALALPVVAATFVPRVIVI